MVLDGPAGVWKGKIEVEENERYIGKGEGGEAWVGFGEGAGTVVAKKQDGEGWREKLRKVNLWDEEFASLLVELENRERATEATKLEMEAIHVIRSLGYVPPPSSFKQNEDWHIEHTQTKGKSILSIFNMTAATAARSAERQMASIQIKLCKILEDNNRAPSDIVFTTLLLHSMADFLTVNKVYTNIFHEPNPPARVTVACGDCLPEGVKIMASFLIDIGPRQSREGLHVQSRSYWAPANIGPYSQAISIPVENEVMGNCSLVYVAGQIPLVPASMEVLREERGGKVGLGNRSALSRRRICLSLQHLWRIGKAMHVQYWTGAIAFIADNKDPREKAIMAWLAWKYVHKSSLKRWGKKDIKDKHEDEYEDEDEDEESEDGPDVWDKVYGGLGNHAVEEEKEQRLPDFGIVDYDTPRDAFVPGFFAVQVAQLPRGCDIEWQSLGIAHSEIVGLDYREHQTSFAKETRHISIPMKTPVDTLRAALHEILDPVVIAGLECRWRLPHATIYTKNPSLVAGMKAQIVPCKAVWGDEGIELAAAVVVLYENQ